MKITKHEIFDIVELWQRNGCCKINVSLAYSGKTPTVIEVPKIVRDNGRSLKVVECYLEGYGDPHDIKKSEYQQVAAWMHLGRMLQCGDLGV